MARASAALALAAAVAAGVLLVSGGSPSDPRTPAALPGMPPPFLGTAVAGSGGLTAAIDPYGDVADLRPSPAGRPLIDNPAARQAAGTVPPGTGIVPRLVLPGGRRLPFWRADAVAQRYRPGTNVVVTTARFRRLRATVVYAAADGRLACLTRVGSAAVVLDSESGPVAARLRCDGADARATVRAATRADRGWLAASAPLGPSAPPWASAMYARSLLTLRALTDLRSGAVAAGARDGWAYVWPRDAAAAALAFAAAGHRSEARRVAGFLRQLDLGAAARFHGDRSPVAGRGPQGDARGWVAVASRAAGLAAPAGGPGWRDRPDDQEKAPGDFLGNWLSADATAARRPRTASGFTTAAGLVRVAGDPASGADSAAAWAVRPFTQPRLFGPARASLRHLLAASGRFGIGPSADWPGTDPWTAPTAWSAWAFAALARHDRGAGLAGADRRAALTLLADLRRAATPAGTLPERVDARTGVPRSTTPLAWSHAFAVLALRELWPTP
ncbi:MAG TPA: hypothetical protein VHA54_01495 [Solirubrobacterales bacterium]|nr:hypothetical protein [Solirubrobacterales bacterium]